MSTTHSLESLCLEALSAAHETVVSLGAEGARREVHRADTDITTKCDLQVSKRLLDFFREGGTPAVVYSEESGRVELTSKPEYTISFDDIDGTDNYFRGRTLLPHCTVITLFDSPAPKFEDALIAGVIEHRSETVWHAVRGGGCHFNGVKTRTSRKTDPQRDTLVVVDHYASRSEVCRLKPIYDLCWVKDFGSAALHLAGVSSGLFDAYVSFSQKAHELGAGYLLVKEAGGCVRALDDDLLEERTYDFDARYRIMAAASEALCDALQSTFRSLQ
jgi:myo-inositol-1(or 4)-monophosphatase